MQKNLNEAIAALEKVKAEIDPNNDDDCMRLYDYYEDINYWREQVNFAWQDDEAEANGWD